MEDMIFIIIMIIIIISIITILIIILEVWPNFQISTFFRIINVCPEIPATPNVSSVDVFPDDSRVSGNSGYPEFSRC